MCFSFNEMKERACPFKLRSDKKKLMKTAEVRHKTRSAISLGYTQRVPGWMQEHLNPGWKEHHGPQRLLHRDSRRSGCNEHGEMRMVPTLCMQWQKPRSRKHHKEVVIDLDPTPTDWLRTVIKEWAVRVEKRWTITSKNQATTPMLSITIPVLDGQDIPKEDVEKVGGTLRPNQDDS